MLNSPTRLADFSLIRRNDFKRFFIQAKNQAVRAIPDRVQRDLEPGPVRARNEAAQVLLAELREARVRRRIGVRREKRRGPTPSHAADNTAAKKMPVPVAESQFSS